MQTKIIEEKNNVITMGEMPVGSMGEMPVGSVGVVENCIGGYREGVIVIATDDRIIGLDNPRNHWIRTVGNCNKVRLLPKGTKIELTV